jgi:hypothetical protein
MHAVRSCMAQRAHHRLKPPWNCGWVTQRSDWSYQRNVAEVAKTSRKIEFTVPSRSQISYGGIPWIASTKASGVRCTASHPAIWRLPDHTFAFCICRGEPWAHLQVRMLTCWLLEVIFWCCGARSLIWINRGELGRVCSWGIRSSRLLRRQREDAFLCFLVYSGMLTGL